MVHELGVDQSSTCKRPVLPRRFLEANHYFFGIESSGGEQAISSSSSFFFTLTLRPTDHKTSINAKSSVRAPFTSGYLGIAIREGEEWHAGS